MRTDTAIATVPGQPGHPNQSQPATNLSAAQDPEGPSEAIAAVTRPDGRHLRWSLALLLTGTAVLYLWGLSRNGWANAYYSAAAQAGGSSWKAWFFGSFDAANAITVDKPPASLWVMGLTVRLFGLSYWSVLVPQALMGVASVALLYATVRRWFGARAGLISGAVLATTPVAVLMFRFNNPDALLVLLLIAAAWAMTRATERGSWRWIALAGVFVGFGFLTKMLQALLVLPGFVAMYGVAAPVDLKRRIGHLFAALTAMIGACAWWVAIVEVWPASARPYIGGSQTNSMLELIFGYNGLGRITGNESGSTVPGGGQNVLGGSPWGATGWDRLFNHSYGGQIAWLLPAALAMTAVLFWLSRCEDRTSRIRAAALCWGGWLLVTATVISFSRGIIHEYYTVALAPAIGALTGIGTVLLWERRSLLAARITMSAVVAGTAGWSYALLARSAGFVPPLRWVVVIAGLALTIAILFVNHMGRRLAAAIGMGTLLVLLAGPVSYAAETATTAASGSLPSAGPPVAEDPQHRGGMPGNPPPFGPPFGPPGLNQASGQSNGPFPAVAGTATPPQPSVLPAAGAATGPSGPGGLLSASIPSSQLRAALLEDADQFTWVAATTGSQSAAGYQLATQEPVLSIGGFNGSDPAPTLAQFQEWVAAGSIHYYIAGAGPGAGPRAGPGVGIGRGGDPGELGTRTGTGTHQMGGSAAASAIAEWVSSNYSATTFGTTTVYDLTQHTSAQMSIKGQPLTG